MKKNVLFLLLIIFSFQMYGQNCTDCRFSSYVFDSVSVTNVQFGEGMNADGQNQDLFMDVYEPFGDTMALRPVILFAFGGGFINGSKEEGYVVAACKRFARAGYVTAAIDYRTGVDIIAALSDPLAEMSRVFFRPMQDMRASVQHMYWHADSAGNTWKIDTNMIFIGGVSSGAITAINVAHCDKAAEFAMIGNINGINNLGGFTSTSGYHQSYSWRHHGLVNIAGGTFNTSWIEAGGAPIVSAHGDQDGTVPYAGGVLNLGILNIGLQGSYSVDNTLDSLGTCSYLYTMVGEDHPSGSASDEYFDQIFNRFMPRMKAIVKGESFCCLLDVEIAEGDSMQIDPNTTVNLTANVSGQSATPNYLWCGIPCQSSYSTASISPTIPYTSSYYIAVVTEGNCLATDFIWFAEPVILSAEPIMKSLLSAYPNPTHGKVKIDLKGLKVHKIEIRSLLGQKLKMMAVEKNQEVILLDLNEFQAGVYQIILFAQESKSVLKLVKH